MYQIIINIILYTIKCYFLIIECLYIYLLHKISTLISTILPTIVYKFQIYIKNKCIR